MKKVIIPEINNNKVVSLETIELTKGSNHLLFGSLNKEPKGFILYINEEWVWCDKSDYDSSEDSFSTVELVLSDLIENILSVYPNMEFYAV